MAPLEPLVVRGDVEQELPHLVGKITEVMMWLRTAGYSALSVVPEPPNWRALDKPVTGARFFFGRDGRYASKVFSTKLLELASPKAVSIAIDRSWHTRFDPKDENA